LKNFYFIVVLKVSIRVFVVFLFFFYQAINLLWRYKNHVNLSHKFACDF